MSYTVAYLWQIHYNSHNETLEIFIVGYDVKEHISQDFLFVLILKYFFFFFPLVCFPFLVLSHLKWFLVE